MTDGIILFLPKLFTTLLQQSLGQIWLAIKQNKFNSIWTWCICVCVCVCYDTFFRRIPPFGYLWLVIELKWCISPLTWLTWLCYTVFLASMSHKSSPLPPFENDTHNHKLSKMSIWGCCKTRHSRKHIPQRWIFIVRTSPFSIHFSSNFTPCHPDQNKVPTSWIRIDHDSIVQLLQTSHLFWWPNKTLSWAENLQLSSPPLLFPERRGHK